MIPKVQPEHIRKVKKAFDVYQDTRNTKIKTAQTAAYIETFNIVEQWLWDFICYITNWNSPWKGVDFQAYYCIPCSKKQEKTFDDYLALLRHYQRKKVTSKNEKELVNFLRGCTREFRDFYEILLARVPGAENLLMNKKLGTSPQIVTTEDIFGGGVLLGAEALHVVYPVIVTTLPDRPLKQGIIQRDINTQVSVLEDVVTATGETTQNRRILPGNKNWLKVDKKMIHTSKYLITGFIDEENKEFFPLDKFATPTDYRHYIEQKKEVAGYEQRQLNLDKFLQVNFLRQIKRVPRIYCINQGEVDRAISKVLMLTNQPIVCIQDSQHRTYTARTYELQGVASDFWQSVDGEILGLKVWNNGREINCSVDFSGEFHPLLYNPHLVLKRYVKFWLFDFPTHAVGAVKEILFDRQIYIKDKYTFRDGTVGYIECCPFCLRDDYKHRQHGLCLSTIKGLYSMYATRGVNKWFPASPRLRQRQIEKHFRPEFLENVQAVFKGYRVRMNDKHQIMFATDESAEREYARRVESLERRDAMPVIKRVTQEDFRQAYMKRFNLVKQKELPSEEVLSGDRSVEEVNGVCSPGRAGGDGGFPADLQ